MQQRYLIVADDFTGANDTGVQIRRRGLPISVVFSAEMIPAEHTAEHTQDSFVIDTESRALSPEKAFQQLTSALEGVDFSQFDHVIKKVDSTLRGSVGAEIKAVVEAMEPDMVLFAPALPELGRTTVDGVHRLKGVPITQTEMAKDPQTPVTEDCIHRLLEDALGSAVSHCSLETIRQGWIPFETGNYFTFDCETTQDMVAIVKAGLATEKRILWVGSASIADALLHLQRPVAPAFGVVSSISNTTNEQVQYAEQQGIKLVSLPIHELLEDDTKVSTYVDEAVESLLAGKDTLLISSASYHRDEELAKSKQAGEKLGISLDEISVFTQELVGKLSRQVLDRVSVSGVFLTGGDTAISFFQHAESQGSSIITEIATGIPMMHLRGGSFNGLKIVTKAGAFGKEDAIVYALRKLKELEE